MSAVALPIQRGFTYEVRLCVSIPIAWAELLKLASKHHYDYKCRECGDRGVVNALYNTACDGEYPSNHPVTFSDLNLVSKVAEQLHHHSEDRVLVLTIRAWLRDAMDAIEQRRLLCAELPGAATEEAP